MISTIWFRVHRLFELTVSLYRFASSALFLCVISVSFTWTYSHILRSAGTWGEEIWREADPFYLSLLPSQQNILKNLIFHKLKKKESINFKSQLPICNITIKTFVHCIDLFVMYIVFFYPVFLLFHFVIYYFQWQSFVKPGLFQCRYK